MFSFDVVPGRAVSRILDASLPEVVDIVEDVYVRHSLGQTINPDSYFLRFPADPASRIIALPASVDLEHTSVTGIKWISSFPSNVAAGLPRASAVIILNDSGTGYPYACLEAASISAARTAASAAVGARAIAQHVSVEGTIGIVGGGVIARTILRYLDATGYGMHTVKIFDLDRGSADHLAAFVRETLGHRAIVADHLTEVLDAQTLVTATTAAAPYIDRLLEPGQVVLNISLRDLAPEVVLGAENYFDDVEHCMKANTSPHLAEQATGRRDFVTGTVGELLRGENKPVGDRGIVYSPFGLGVLDLAVAHHVLGAARAQGDTIDVPGFFGETQRW